MFTGLVQSMGIVRAIVPGPESKRLVVGARLDARAREVGASVAFSGVCLTLTAAGPEQVEAEAAFETLACTTLHRLAVGQTVNLEPALRLGDPVGGHLVSGHVDGVGEVASVRERGPARELWIVPPPPLMRLIAPKGAVCLDGVSLTVNEVADDRFSVGLIPHTLAVTTLGGTRPGDVLNVEIDLIARYVARLVEGGPASVDAERLSLRTLEDAGFLSPREDAS